MGVSILESVEDVLAGSARLSAVHACRSSME